MVSGAATRHEDYFKRFQCHNFGKEDRDLTINGGQAAVGWQNDIAWFRSKGYDVQVTQDLVLKNNGEVQQILTGKAILGLIGGSAKKKQLAGLMITGHGYPAGIANQGWLPRPGAEIVISYKQIRDKVPYGLPWVILNVCFGGFKKGDTVIVDGKNLGKLVQEGGMDLSSNSPGSKFYGITKTLVPPFESGHPKNLKPLQPRR